MYLVLTALTSSPVSLVAATKASAFSFTVRMLPPSEILYKILNEFGIPRKLVRLIKMSLTETYSRVRVGKNVSDRFPIRNGLKQGDALSSMIFNFALEYAIGAFR